MYGDVQTAAPLKLLGGTPNDDAEGLRLAPSERLQRFALAAGSAGLELPEALQLAVERTLALSDCYALGVDRETARRKLCRAAEGARPTQKLSPAQAARIRRLNLRRRRATADVSEGCTVPLPDDLLTRSRDAVSYGAIDAEALEEMILWEIAATLSGRTMCEWAMLALAGGRPA